MSLPVTTVSAVLLSALLIVLSVRVILGRRDTGVSLGDGGEDILSRRIRAQGNLAEYAPMGILLTFLAEYQGALTWIVAFCAAVFVIGRLSHGYALSFKAAASGARIRGMIMTFVGLVLLAAANLWMILTHIFQ